MDLMFTVVMRAAHGYQLLIELRYAPTILWVVNGRQQRLQVEAQELNYRPGAFHALLRSLDIKQGPLPGSRCAVVFDPDWRDNAGYDSGDALGLLVADIRASGFIVEQVSL